jgi:two-component system sensor histidine kinase/response regulator
MPVPIERKILAGFVVAFAASVLLGIALCQSANQAVATQLRIGHSEQVVGELDRFLEFAIDLDSAWTGYRLSQDEHSLARIKELEGIIPIQLDKLRALVVDNVEQKQRIDILESATVGAFKSINEAVNPQTGVSDAAKERTGAQDVKARFDEVQIALRQTKQAERKLFEVHFSADKDNIQNSTKMILVTVLLQFCILGFLYWRVRTESSERRRTEKAARKSSEELAAAHDAAVSATKIKSQFLANMSHEIRTPMNGVLGMTEILLDTSLTARQREFAETIQSSGNALLSIINDILDFSKMEAGMQRYERLPFNLHKTVESVIDSFVQSARKKGLELAVLIEEQVPASVSGDPFRLRQVLTNLLGNAIKFTNAGEVVLRCKELPDSGGGIIVRFEVSDTGIGLSPEDQEALFRPFVQADGSATRHFGGTGLGLAISKQIVTGMGGEMGIESTPGLGSKFWFTLKFEKAESFAPGRSTTGDLRNVRVLLVDDNSTNRKILHYQVSLWGMRDSLASSGPAAITLLRKAAAQGDPYTVAIMDAHMPELNGPQTVELIRADPSVAAVKVVLLTSAETDGLGADLSNHVDAFISKPVKQSQLYETLCRVIGIGAEAPAEEESEPESVFLTSDERKLRILLAEDNPVNQRVALYQLRMLEHHVELAQDGAAALKLFEEHEFDVVLMDIHMPKLDGYFVTNEIRRREANQRHTWIIAMTANALPEDREKCLAAGMDDYLAKPIQARTLVYALEKCVIQSKSVSPATDLRPLVESGLGDMVPELISVFLNSALRDIEKMRLAAGKNANLLVGAAHSLKGSCSNLGASGLRDLCQQIENHGKAGALGEASKLLAPIELEFGRVKDELLAVLEEQASV